MDGNNCGLVREMLTLGVIYFIHIHLSATLQYLALDAVLSSAADVVNAS